MGGFGIEIGLNPNIGIWGFVFRVSEEKGKV